MRAITVGASLLAKDVNASQVAKLTDQVLSYSLIQELAPAQVIDKGISTADLLARVMVAKFADHLPLYRQETIFGRAGLAIARSTLAQWGVQTGVPLQLLALQQCALSKIFFERCRGGSSCYSEHHDARQNRHGVERKR
ncbi:hypothetical protein BK651_23435 [Pseudomonas rhodesiae]|nr:hypothetical protein BK650_19415 [Pseudomonas rhodesiae]ROM61426.1 hypothetical protein BK651_23435 [Pseudomonas rhodesiae]